MFSFPKSKKRKEKKEKRSQVFCQSAIHLARYNLRKCQSHLFELVFKALKNFSRFNSYFSRFFDLKPLFSRFFW